MLVDCVHTLLADLPDSCKDAFKRHSARPVQRFSPATNHMPTWRSRGSALPATGNLLASPNDPHSARHRRAFAQEIAESHVALRLSPDALPDSNNVSHKLGTFYSVLCAAPAYLELHGTPRSEDDLAHHVCMQVAMPIFPSERWLLIGPDGEREFQLQNARFKLNVPDAMAAALHEGMGIGALPSLTIRSAVNSGS